MSELDRRSKKGLGRTQDARPSISLLLRLAGRLVNSLPHEVIGRHPPWPIHRNRATERGASVGVAIAAFEHVLELSSMTLH
jgi:hypothetical protein